MYKKILLFLSVVLTYTCIISADGMGETIIDRYMPLTKGSYWTYTIKKKVILGVLDESMYRDMWRAPEEKGSNIREVSYSVTLSVTSVEEFKDMLIVHMEQRDDAENMPVILIYDKDKVFIMRAQDIDINSLKANKEILDSFTPQFYFPLYDGSYKEFTIGQENGKKGIYAVKKVEEITTPAGIFKDCFMVTTESDFYIMKRVYVPNVGIVMEEYDAKDKSCHVIYELEDYKIF